MKNHEDPVDHDVHPGVPGSDEAVHATLEMPPPSGPPPHRPPGETAAVGDAVRPGVVIANRYKLLQQIGEGGFGVVYLAEQEHPVRRRVALKVIKLGMDTKQVIARFQAERQALAMLSHPNVAVVHDAGATETGRPYFVMEYVPGEPITAFCDRHNYTTRQRLELFTQACEAIQHAHQKAIIHRDVKPSNLLVMLKDDKPHVKVIDFGVAKATAHRLTEQTLFTEQGQLIGTPEYMSPEQAEMNALDVDTRTDIYSLGVVLYELLTGAVPFDPKSLRRAAYGEIQRIIREVDPPRPSARLSGMGDSAIDIAKHRRIELGSLERQLRRELEWIPLKALRKDPSQRYRTAMELAEDVQNYLGHKPLIAGPQSTFYRAKARFRRNKGPVMAAAAVLCVLLIGVTVASWQAVRLAAANRFANAKTREAESQRDESEKLRAAAVASDLEAQRSRADAYVFAGESLHKSADFPESRQALIRAWDDYRKLGVPETGVVCRLLDSYRAAAPPLLGSDGPRESVGGFQCDFARRLAISADGRHAVSAAKFLSLWDLRTGLELRRFVGHTAMVWSVAFSPDGRTIASASSDQTIKLWDAASGECIQTLRGHQGSVTCLAFTPDGFKLISGSGQANRSDRTIRIWDLRTGTQLHTLRAAFETTWNLAVSADGKTFASASNDAVRLWNVDSGILLSKLDAPRHLVYAVTFTPDGRYVISGGDDHVIWIHDVSNQEKARQLAGHKHLVYDLAVSRDGTRLVSGGGDMLVKLWDLASGRELRTFCGHRDGVFEVAFLENERVVSCSEAQIKIWDLDSEASEVPRVFLPTGKSPKINTSPDGLICIAGVGGGGVRILDVATGLLLRTFGKDHDWPRDVALSRDGRTAVVPYAGADELITLWDVQSGSERVRLLRGHTGQVWSCAFSPDGMTLLSGGLDGKLCVWDWMRGEKRKTIQAGRTITALAVSKDGRWAVTTGYDATVRLFDLETGQQTYSIEEGQAMNRHVAISPDGHSAVSCGFKPEFRTRDLRNGKAVSFSRHLKYVFRCEFSPEGNAIASVGDDGALKLWDAASGKQHYSFSAHSDWGEDVAWVDNETVLTAGRDGLLRIWDLSRPRTYREFERTIPAARESLRSNAEDPAALRTFGEWYAFRGAHDWAADFLTRARRAGGHVSALTLARCYWRLGRLDDAAHEFREALRRNEAPAEYLNLCIQAVTPSPASVPSMPARQ